MSSGGIARKANGRSSYVRQKAYRYIGVMPLDLLFAFSIVAILTSIFLIPRARRSEGVSETNHELFQGIVKEVEDLAIFLLDPDGKVLSWNDGARRIKGYEATEIVGSNFNLFYTPEDVAKSLPQRILEIAKRDGQYSAEDWRVRRDGSRFFASVLITAIHNKNGELTGFSKITRDLTSRETAERQKQLEHKVDRILATAVDESQLFQEILEAVTDHLGWKVAMVWSEHDGVLVCNEAYSSEGDTKAAEFAEKSRRFWFAPGEGLPGEVWKSRAGAWFLETAIHANFPRRALSQSAGIITGFGIPIMYDNQFFACCEFFTDKLEFRNEQILRNLMEIGIRVGQRVQYLRARLEIDQQARYLQSILDGFPNPLVVKDLNGRFMLANLTLAKMLGTSSKDIQGKRLADLVGPEIADASEEEERQVVLTRQALTHERTTNFQGRPSTHLVTRYPLFNARGDIVSVCSVSTDITKQKEAEAAALASADAKSRFLMTMSHEIRTPLNSIIGMSGLLADMGLTEAQGRLVEDLKANADSLLDLINDILDSSRIDAGKLELENIEFDLAEVADEVCRSVSVFASQKSLIVEENGFTKLSSLLMGDPGRIRQILVNLMSNAVKFTKEGRVSLDLKVLEDHTDSVKLRISVSDTGIGIPEDKKDVLFKPFVQGDTSTTRKYGGTGLGLSICRDLVGLMGGEIDFVSQVNRGSTFWVELVLRRGAARTQKMGKAAKHRRAQFNARVLVAEDNRFNQIVLRAQLQLHGIRVDMVANGGEAITAVKKIPYDLVFMDCHMPEVDGFEASRAIRKDERVRGDLPIVAFTADAFEESRSRCLEAGMSDFVTKPLSPDTLEQTLLAWLKPIEDSLHKLDLKRIEQLEVLQVPGEPDIVGELVQMYFLKRAELETELRSRGKHRFPEISHLAHQLKSHARTLGAGYLGSLLENLELAARKAETHEVKAVAEQVLLGMPVVDEQLRALLSNRAPRFAA